jgi:hypothetical protein
MATIKKWWPRRVVSPALITGVPVGNYFMDGGPLWVPDLLRYVCVWYWGSTVLIRYLGSATNLYSYTGGSVGGLYGSFYYGGYIYVLRAPGTAVVISKINVSTWVATDVATIYPTVLSARYASIFFDGTSTIFCDKAYNVPPMQGTLQKSDISTPDSPTVLVSGYSHAMSATPRILGVDNTYVYFWADGTYYSQRRRVPIAGGSAADTTWLMFGRPGYHTQGGNVLYNKAESLSWDLGRVPSSLVTIEEATPVFIFQSGGVIYFYEGATLRQTIASSAIFKDNCRDSYVRSDGSVETLGHGLIEATPLPAEELAPVRMESI